MNWKKLKYFLAAGVITFGALGGYNVQGRPLTQDERIQLELQNIIVRGKTYRYDSILEELKNRGFSVTKEELMEDLREYHNQNGEKILEDTGGFLTTQKMLNTPIDELFFVSTHNSFANNRDGEKDYSDDFKTGTKNQYLSMYESLQKGVRVLDIDMGDDGDSKHTICYHKFKPNGETKIQTVADTVKRFLDENPNDILFLHLSDFYNDPKLWELGNAKYNEEDWEYYRHINRFLKYVLRNRELTDNAVNFFGDMDTPEDQLYKYVLHPGVEYNDGEDSYSMEEWPTVGEMIGENKRLVIFMPTTYLDRNEKTGKRKKNLGFKSEHYIYKNSDEKSGSSQHQERVNPFNVASGLDGEKTVKDRFFMISNTPDGGSSAGWDPSARINNNGRRIYELVKGFNSKFNGQDYANIVDLDFFRGSGRKGGRGTLEVDAVDAANRINFENCGMDWNNMKSIDESYYWNTYSQNIGRIPNEKIESVLSDATYEPWKNREYHSRYHFSLGAEALIDGNVWSGYDNDSDISGKDIIFNFKESFYFDRICLNFYTGNGNIGYKISVSNGDSSFKEVKSGTIALSRDLDWYNIDLPSDISGDRVKIVLDTNGNDGKSLKEVGFIQGEPSEEIEDVIIYPSHDAYVKRGKYGGNNYNNDRIEVSYDSRNDHRRYGFMRFDTKNIGSVQRATLKLYADNQQSDAAPLEFKNVTLDSWHESAIDWDGMRNYIDSAVQATLHVDKDGWYEIDVTNWFNARIREGKDMNFCLIMVYGNRDNVNFGSKESGNKPQLIVRK